MAKSPNVMYETQFRDTIWVDVFLRGEKIGYLLLNVNGTIDVGGVGEIPSPQNEQDLVRLEEIGRAFNLAIMNCNSVYKEISRLKSDGNASVRTAEMRGEKSSVQEART